MCKVKQENPHVLVLCGPFVDGLNEDVKSGLISYRNSTGQLEFLDFDDIFSKVMQYIHSELSQQRFKTKVVIVPSAREIHHIKPMPQTAFAQSKFPAGMEPILLGNPQLFRINDINIGVVNADIVKDLCTQTHNKASGSKIDGSVKSILQQRSFYPLYPGQNTSPIEWE